MVSDDDEELEIPMHIVPVSQLPNVLPEDPTTPSGDPVTQPVSTALEDIMHISTQDHPPVLASPSATAQPPPTILAPMLALLTMVDCSALINKVHAGELPAITITPHPDAPGAHSEEAMVTPISKIFTAESTSLSLEPEPVALPECLVKMALNIVFIPLSMLMMESLNGIETNQVKNKHVTYGSGTGRTFLDDAVCSSEDSLSDFEFGQAYTNWLTLIKAISDPVMEQGWHAHHKYMVSVRDFLD